MQRRSFLKTTTMMTLKIVSPIPMLNQAAKTKSSYDVVIFGATPSGIIAAIRMAREAKKVLLVSVSENIGGMIINGLSMMDTLYEGFRSPLYEELLSKIRTYYADKYGSNAEINKFTIFGNPADLRERPRFEAHVILKIFNDWLTAEPSITVIRHYEVESLIKNNRLIKSVLFRSMQNDRDIDTTAAVFMDCSYEGDLMAKAGIAYVVGRESQNEFNELHAGKIFVKNIPGAKDKPPKVNLNLAAFGGVTQQTLDGSTGQGDKAIQAYNMRFVFTTDPKNRKNLVKPNDYDRNRYLKLVSFQGIAALAVKPVPLMNNKINDPGFSDSPDFNIRYPEANWTDRKKIIKKYVDHGLGQLYFLQNDDTVPLEIKKKSSMYGLPLDEYQDNGGVPYEVYVREARRMRGRYVFTENDTNIPEGINRTLIHNDAIAISDWPCDVHECTGEHSGPNKEGFFILVDQTRPSQVPYKSLLPKDIDNLIVPVCLSATHVGFGSIRVEPVWMHIAESAAWACILAINNNKILSALPVTTLQKILVEKHIMISFFNKFDMATEGKWVQAIQYWGTKGFFSSYDALPEERLKFKEAELWINAARLHKLGNNQPMAMAKKISGHTNNSENVQITTIDFINKAKPLQIAISVWSKIIQDFKIGKDDFILRKDACLFLYELYS